MPKDNKNILLGKYEILEKIGEGGFGVVYRGHDLALNRQVAVKVLHANLVVTPEFIERFKREARLAASLHHPNIITMLDVGEEERYFLVMELLPGGTLRDLLKNGKPMPLARTLELLKPIAEALDYAHSKEMVHRDVKPSNILLREDGQPVLTDFGLAKSLSDSSVSSTGLAVGTAEYMAPEQVLGNPPGPATDIYALGVIAYQMLTGKVPFSGTTPYSIQKGHAEGRPPDPREINPALGEQTAQILLKSLEKEPQSRFQSGAELVAAFSAIAEQEQERYWKALYDEANALMEKKEYGLAEEKWTALQEAKPDYKDTAAQLMHARQQVELGERYEKLVKQADALKTDAQAILAADSDYPDEAEVFVRLGARPAPHTKPRETKPEVKPEEIKLGVGEDWPNSGSPVPTSVNHYSAQDEAGDESASNITDFGSILLFVFSIFGTLASIMLLMGANIGFGVSVLVITLVLWSFFLVRINKTKNKDN
jgi:hypothetical protein